MVLLALSENYCWLFYTIEPIPWVLVICFIAWISKERKYFDWISRLEYYNPSLTKTYTEEKLLEKHDLIFVVGVISRSPKEYSANKRDECRSNNYSKLYFSIGYRCSIYKVSCGKTVSNQNYLSSSETRVNVHVRSWILHLSESTQCQ
jgi:hypothetical protein